MVETLEISTDMILVTISGRSVARLQNQNLTKAAGKEIETFSRTTSVDVSTNKQTLSKLIFMTAWRWVLASVEAPCPLLARAVLHTHDNGGRNTSLLSRL